ncbi:RING-H2 finger protein ATL70 [Arachis ipaensis]|uniref:RING-type domain-containing protein n=1 Tax=Arachis hypogaea TaxID=3818 RepID=A0A445E7R1_ARAHY|nr:RING-H2 finger protein ATL70 [Arachis ipaensis]XP_025634782.1 RING-H2 finger protein ATL70 [Arachis hypogaea]RYR71471.1 hypothetical protein Ahy_A02g005735 isoform C [Arachis hypogaea]
MSNHNTTSDSSSGFLGSNDISGFGYGIGISIGILLLITTITLTSYFCTRTQVPNNNNSRSRSNPTPGSRRSTQVFLEPQHTVVDVGLDEATILGYPKMLYSESKKLNKKSDDSTSTCCSICLGDYKGSDMLRVLPDCEHVFHLKCIDPWLRLHPTCPLCRTSPIPTPLSTPLAEVVPLATRRD